MQIYELTTLVGCYQRSSKSPNVFTSDNTDIILRTRTNPQLNQTKYYLLFRRSKGKSQYLSALWTSNSTAQNGLNTYSITDTQGSRGLVEIDIFTLKISSL